MTTNPLNSRYQQREDPKCVVNCPLQNPEQPYSLLCWCVNEVIVGATGHALHYIDAASGRVTEVIEDAHSKRITSLCATAAPVVCGEHGKQCVVVTAGMDGKARAWRVPDACK